MYFSKKTFTYGPEELSSKLLEGSAVLFPTDTLPALASAPEAASQLWNIKKRPSKKPLILMGAIPSQLFEFVSLISLEDAEKMANRFWPGALTMILPASGPIVDSLNPGGANIGMRVPACEATIELLLKSGPLATTSANLAGHSPCLNAREAFNLFPDLPLLGPLPWPLGSGLASTVIAWSGRGCWQVLRRGAVIIPEDKK